MLFHRSDPVLWATAVERYQIKANNAGQAGEKERSRSRRRIKWYSTVFGREGAGCRKGRCFALVCGSLSNRSASLWFPRQLSLTFISLLTPSLSFLPCCTLVRTCFFFSMRGDVILLFAQATAVVFDKTGTLTTGKSTITGVISLDEEWHADRVRCCSTAECLGVCVLHRKPFFYSSTSSTFSVRAGPPS